MNTVSRLYYRSWRMLAVALSLVIVAYVLYFHRLGSLVPGYSSAELASRSASLPIHTIATNPVNAPYKLLIWLLDRVGKHSLLNGRAIAACFGTLAASTFFVIIRRWHGFRVAWLATLMFATSAGLLHPARTATPQILQMSILVFIGAVTWYRWRKTDRRVLLTYLCVALFAIMLYVPGMIWLELFGVVLLRRGVLAQLRTVRRLHVATWLVLFLALILPLAIAAFKDTHIVLDALGLPRNLHALRNFGSNLLNTICSIGVRSNGDASLWVGHAPLLNVAELVLGAWGIYRYLRLEVTARSVFVAGSGILAIILISFGGSVSFTLLVPLLYLCIASGLDGFLSQWLRVFPRNPIARSTGTILISLVVAFSILYQVRSYFVAWPHTAATHQLYSHVQPH